MERLLKQIGTFMSDIADEFKIVVVEAIRSLCLKFPQKYRALMNFLSNVRASLPWPQDAVRWPSLQSESCANDGSGILHRRRTPLSKARRC